MPLFERGLSVGNQMKRIWRTGAIVATAVLSSIVLASCGSSSGSGAGTVSSIKVVIAEYSKDHTKAFWDAFTKTYEKKTGVKLNLQIINWNDIDQQSSTMVQTGNLPDILNSNAFASYAADDLLYSAGEVLSPATRADIIPAFVTSGSYQGTFFGMPDLSSARALFYNTALFTSAGIASPPTTWDEFTADAKKIAALGNGVVGYAQPLGPEEAQAELAIWLFNNGGQFTTGGKWTLNSSNNIATLEFLKSLSVTDKVTQNNPGSTNRTDGAFSLFEQGKAGMVVGFSPLQGALESQHPDVKYAIAPMPSGNAAAPQTYGVTDYLMSFKKKGNQAAVTAFYSLYYAPDQVNAWIKAEGFLPVTTSGLTQFSSDPALKVYLDTLPNIHLTPTDDPEWDKIKLSIQQNVGLAVGPNGNPKKFLDGLQAQAEAGK